MYDEGDGDADVAQKDTELGAVVAMAKLLAADATSDNAVLAASILPQQDSQEPTEDDFFGF